MALGVVGLLLAGLHPAVAPRAEAATAVLSPNGDVSNSWQVKPGGAAWAAVDDGVTQPTAVPATDYLYAGSANAVVQLGMSSTAIGANATTSGQVWFYANTGPGTQLRVEALWSGAVRATSTVPAGQGFAWRSLAVAPSGQADVDDLRLRFTALGGGDANVRATYATLDTVALLRSLTWENAPDRTLPGAAPSGWNKQWCCTDSAQLSTTVVRAGGYASRFELRDTDADVSSSKRAELSSAVVDPDNSERWYGFSVYLPADTWAPDPSAEVLAQWHQDSESGSPPLSIDTHAGNWEVAVFGNAVPLIGPSQAYATNAWTDWVVHVKWAANTQGLIEIWRGADLVYRQTGTATKADDHKGVYAKFGVYKWGWKGVGPTPVTHRRVVFHDELRIGDQSASRATVAPR